MKTTRISLTLLSILLICALALNFTACRTESITCYPEPTRKVVKDTAKAPAIQATNLMQSFEANEVVGKTPDDAFIGAQMDFALSLFQGSVKESGEENLLVSPLSVMLALAMTANGADGETKAEMEALLGGELSIDTLNQYLYSYVNALPSEEKYKLEIANSIWFKDNEEAITVSPDFLQTNADYYGAAAYKAPFDGQTVSDINNWVKQHTDGMIDKIIDDLDPDTVMCLINALVFEAEWQEPYYDYQVTEGIFTALNGEAQTVKMMHSDEGYYLNDGSATGFIKHYKDAEYSFVALLPNEGVDLYDYIEGLTADSLSATIANAERGVVEATLPKFSYDYELEMNALLSEMGMPTAFDDDRADFSKLGQSTIYERFYISRVIHKTHITVDELGTKAGAVTAVIMNAAEGMPDMIRTVTLDRPFVYLIIDNENDLPIFMGTVTDISK